MALFSALDLASSYVLGQGFIWVHAWPTFWFVWFVGIHCVFAYVLQQLVKSVASLPSLFYVWKGICLGVNGVFDGLYRRLVYNIW